MLETSNDIYVKTESLVLEFNQFCVENNLLEKVQADHIGLKCSSSELYEKQRALFDFACTFGYQSIISKRRISVVGLLTGIKTEVGDFKYLELSDQKPDGSQTDVFDHAEIVPTTISYDELVDILRTKGVQLKENMKAHHTTYDVVLSSGFVVKLSREMLIDKIKRVEMK